MLSCFPFYEALFISMSLRDHCPHLPQRSSSDPTISRDRLHRHLTTATDISLRLLLRHLSDAVLFLTWSTTISRTFNTLSSQCVEEGKYGVEVMTALYARVRILYRGFRKEGIWHRFCFLLCALNFTRCLSPVDIWVNFYLF